MSEPSYIRPSDHRAPEDYAEWLQVDARLHARDHRAGALHRLAVAAALLAIAIAVGWGLSGYAGAWRGLERPMVAAP